MGYKDGGYDANRYQVIKRSTGEEVQEKCFTLIPAHDLNAVRAVLYYADLVEAENPDLAQDIRKIFMYG